MADWSTNAKILLEARYLKRDKDGNLIETPDQLLSRVARAISNIEKDRDHWYEKFLGMMDSLEFLPNTPTLVNAGTELGQLSACFVLPVEDQIEAIFEAVKQSAVIHKSGGGTGFNFSKLRPRGARVGSTSGVASGPVSFMKCFDAVTDTIKQGGIRRGANIGILNDNHQDIQEFINCKNDINDFQNFNVSVALTDKFLESVERKGVWHLVNPSCKIDKIEVDAEELFTNLYENAWKTGEPGVIFIDTINKFNTVPWMGKIESTNPCGEQPLLPYESCNLGSIDMSKFITDGEVDFNKLETIIRIAIRFLDDVIDVNKYPRVKIERKTKKTRKIGLGIMGWADFLIALKIGYNTKEALLLASRVAAFFKNVASNESLLLAQEKGAFDGNSKKSRRTATVLTIAPTGSLSILADCSSSIEPIFDVQYSKRVLDRTILNLGEKYEGYDKKYLVTAKELSKNFKAQPAKDAFNRIEKRFQIERIDEESAIRKSSIDYEK